MPQPDEGQRLIEEHITTLGEQKAQLERALGDLRGSAGGEGKNAGRGRGAGAGRSQDGERAPRGARRGEVIADLKANPGDRGESEGQAGSTARR
jgi:hypothetical protein